jgi:adenylosuccinate synthase
MNGRLNINLRGGKGSNGDPTSKSSQALHHSRNESRVLAKAKLVPQTLIDLASKAKIVKCGHQITSKAYEITSKDGETGKGIGNATLNNAAKLNNNLKAQQLKKAEWAMIKDDLEHSAPGMENVAANFMKQQFANLYAMTASTLPTQGSSHHSLLDDTIVSSQSDQA